MILASYKKIFSHYITEKPSAQVTLKTSPSKTTVFFLAAFKINKFTRQVFPDFCFLFTLNLSIKNLQ